MNFSALNKQRKFLLIAALAGIVSIFLPWYTAGGLFEGFNINGFRGIGVFVFFLFAGVVVVALLGDQTKPLDATSWLIALAAGAVALLSIVSVIAGIGDPFGISAPGIGLWIALAASLGVIAFAWIHREAGLTLQNAFDSLKSKMNTPNSNAPKPPTAAGSSKIDELEKLIELKNQGKISEEEYQSLKSKII